MLYYWNNSKLVANSTGLEFSFLLTKQINDMNNVVTKKINFTLLISKVDKHNDWIENVDAESVLKGIFDRVTPTELIVGTEFAKSTIKWEVLRELNRLGIIKDIYGKESVYLGISICVGKDNYVYISVNVESK